MTDGAATITRMPITANTPMFPTIVKAECSAGFQPAVSQGFQPASRADRLARTKTRAVCRLEIGDTAGWKPALRNGARTPRKPAGEDACATLNTLRRFTASTLSRVFIGSWPRKG